MIFRVWENVRRRLWMIFLEWIAIWIAKRLNFSFLCHLLDSPNPCLQFRSNLPHLHKHTALSTTLPQKYSCVAWEEFLNNCKNNNFHVTAVVADENNNYSAVVRFHFLCHLKNTRNRRDTFRFVCLVICRSEKNIDKWSSKN